MTEITGLNQEIKAYKDIPVKLESNTVTTIKDAMMTFLAQSKFPSAKEDARARKTMMKLDACAEDVIDLEDAELDTLKQAVEQNQVKLPAVVRGAVHDVISSAKEKRPA